MDKLATTAPFCDVLLGSFRWEILGGGKGVEVPGLEVLRQGVSEALLGEGTDGSGDVGWGR